MFAVRLTTTHAALSTAHVSFAMSLRLRMPSKFPPGVPLAQSTPWEYLGQLNSLSSLAITSAPDLAQTATGRSFRNLHNLRELDLPAGLSQLAMRTILNSAGTAVAQRGNRLGDPGQVTLTPQPRSLTHLKAA